MGYERTPGPPESEDPAQAAVWYTQGYPMQMAANVYNQRGSGSAVARRV